MRKKIFTIIFYIFLLNIAVPAAAQTTENTSGAAFDMSGSPQWARDLRRGEIVAFGTFPFAIFFSTFAMDMFRSASNNWDSRYYPWPFKPAGAIGMTSREQYLTIGLAAGTSILVAGIDHLVVRNQRKKQAQQIQNMPSGTPIIIRRPADESVNTMEGESINALETESENN